MKYFNYLEFKDGGYAIGELDADGNRLDGFMYEYWADTKKIGMGEAYDGSINGLGIFEKDDNTFIVAKYNNSKLDDTVFFKSANNSLQIFSHEDGKFYGYTFEIFLNGWRYYFYDENDSMTRMIEYSNNEKTLKMFYAIPGEKSKWCHEIGQKIIDWDVSIPVVPFKNKVYPTCKFVSGNNCINPAGTQGGPCIDYIPEKCEIRIGSINKDAKYEGILYYNLPKYARVCQKTNGYNSGIDFALNKDMSYWVYTWFNEDGTDSNVSVHGWPEQGAIEIRYFNYENSRDFDLICIDKNFNVTIMVQHDADLGSNKCAKCAKYIYDDLYNEDNDQDDTEVEEQNEQEVEEVEEQPRKKELKIKPKTKKILEKPQPKAKKAKEKSNTKTKGKKTLTKSNSGGKKKTPPGIWDGFLKLK